MSRKIYPVILSGGSGTRLWPLSRDLFPKQLLSLVGPESLLAATAKRVSGDSFAGPVIVLQCRAPFPGEGSTERRRHRARGDHYRAGGPQHRPGDRRRRRPAAGTRSPDALMLVLPSDHIIRDLPALTGAIGAAAKAADTAAW